MNERWLALGDSITWGYPEGPHASWTRGAAEALGLAVHNHGVNGDTLDGMHARLAHALAQQHYRFAVFMGGSNDVFMGFPPAALQRNAERIAALLARRGIPFAVGLPVPLTVDAGGEAQLAAIRAWLRGRFAPVIDFAGVFPPGERDALLPDGVHPSSAGYRRMAAAAVPVLRSLTS